MVEGEKKFANVGSVKPSSYLLIDDSVCQVKTVEKSKPGKHGSAKARITAFDIFSRQKKTLMKPVDAECIIPIIRKGIAQVNAIMGDKIQIMDVENFETFDVPKPEGISGLDAGTQIEYIRWGDQAKINRKK